MRLVIENGSTVDVLGADGREFLRMTPSGNLARVASREYQNHMRALLLPPATCTAETPLGEPGKAAWADARLTYSGELPKDIGTKPVRLGRWRIPVIVNGRSAEIAGEQIWDPITPGAGTTSAARPSTHPALYLVAAALTLIPLGAYVIARRRAGKTQM
ncbi:MAG: hypothetical protein HOV67_01370 [Kribbellaceae bacterium]|nr:hypothetical protein [Kribbellaceae bacterium]